MMSTSSPTTPKEQQTAYERWEMSSFTEVDTHEHQLGKQKTTKSGTKDQDLSSVLESIRQEAYTKGMQEGFAVGMTKAKELAAKEQQQFLSIASTFTQALERVDQQIEEDILALALNMAKLMLKQKINIDPTVILPVVRDAIHYLPNVQKPARIIVHQEDARILRDALGEELAEQGWQIQEDHHIERGGCLVETGENQIDASNKVRWKRIADALAQSNNWLLDEC
jgi:flagellar assembly protein FliH